MFHLLWKWSPERKTHLCQSSGSKFWGWIIQIIALIFYLGLWLFPFRLPSSCAFFLCPHHFALPDILCVSWLCYWLLFLWRSLLQEHLFSFWLPLVVRNLNKNVWQMLLRRGKGSLAERWIIMWKLYNSIPKHPLQFWLFDNAVSLRKKNSLIWILIKFWATELESNKLIWKGFELA